MPQSKGPKRPPTFSPTHLSPAFGVDALWIRAAQSQALPSRAGRRSTGLPGSAVKVWTWLKGRTARKEAFHSRHAIARRSKIPLSTVRDGVKALLEAGWLQEGPQGLSLVLGGQALEATKPKQPGGSGEGDEGRESSPRKDPENPSDSMHWTPAAPESNAPGEDLTEEPPEEDPEERPSTRSQDPAEVQARERVAELLRAGKASERAVGAVLGRGRRLWKTWAKLSKVLEAAWRVVELREGTERAIRAPEKYLTACALRPDTGRKALWTAKAHLRHRMKPHREAEKVEEARKAAMSPEELEAERQEAQRRAVEAQAQERARAEAWRRQVAEEERDLKREEKRLARVKTREAAILAETQAAGEATFLRLPEPDRGRLERYRRDATPFRWAVAVLEAAGDARGVDLPRAYHAAAQERRELERRLGQ